MSTTAMTHKKPYEKPTTKVYDLPARPHLLQASNVDPGGPFNWGNPGDDH